MILVFHNESWGYDKYRNKRLNGELTRLSEAEGSRLHHH